MPDKYTKVIQVKPVLEEISTKNSLQVAVNGFFSNFQQKTKSNVDILKDKLKNLKSEINELNLSKALGEDKDADKKLANLNELLSQTKKELIFTKAQSLGQKAQDFTNKIEQIGQKSIQFIKDMGTSAIDFISGLAENAIKEIKNMASYSLSTTLTINQEARDLALQYGFSDAQTYAYSKVSEEMGIKSEEDVWLMTPAQRERFAERIGYYSGEYDKLANKGFFESYERFQAKFTDFKNDVQMKVVEFFTQNEDLITTSLDMGVQILGKILDVVSWISKLQSGGETRSSLNDIINNYTNGNKNTNIKIDNTFNDVSLNDQIRLRNIGNELNRTLLNQIEQI